MYVAVKGGEAAIDNAHALLARARRGDPRLAEIGTGQIAAQLALAVDRAMSEGSLYDRELAALAIKQARGDLVEAVFLLRAYRTTLPRFGATLPVETGAMVLERRISATFKDVPGGQLLGATEDYSHRLLDFALLAGGNAPPAAPEAAPQGDGRVPRTADILGHEGLLEAVPPAGEGEVPDITRQPLRFPASRAERLQNLARGDEGFLLALAYSTQRGFGGTHPFAGEIRRGVVVLEMVPAELGFAIEIGEVVLTECETVNQFHGDDERLPQFTRGYGLAFGAAERKAMAMALVDRALRAGELGEDAAHPASDQEFVLGHSDNVEASGFVQHLKLPHYVDFQAELGLLRQLRRQRGGGEGGAS